MTPPSVERGGSCNAHVDMARDITRLEAEMGHIRQNFDQVTESCERLSEKIDELGSKIASPDITKTWILGAFGLVGGMMTVLVSVISNADKLSKLIGWGG